MTTIRCGDGTVEVHAELDDRADRNGHRVTVYVPECCSARFLSLKVLGINHMNGCPRDRQIRQLLEDEEGS